MPNNKQTICKEATLAARVLSDPNSTKREKSLAGSTLSQTRKGCDRKK